MSTAISAAVWENSTAKATGLLVLLSLADQANDGGWCWPSVETIARRCRISARTVQRFLSELERLGEVEREERPGSSTRYRILVGGDNMTPRQSVRGDNSVTRGVTTVSPRNVSEPSITEDSLRSSSVAREKSDAPKGKRPMRLESGWKPPDEIVWAMREECPRVDVAAEHRKFTDYWLGNGKPMKDWNAVWRNWIRRAAERTPTNGQHRYTLKRQEETDEQYERIMEHAAERDRRLGLDNPARGELTQ